LQAHQQHQAVRQRTRVEEYDWHLDETYRAEQQARVAADLNARQAQEDNDYPDHPGDPPPIPSQQPAPPNLNQNVPLPLPLPPAPVQLPAGRQPYQEPPVRHNLGPMNTLCTKCYAPHFAGEKLSASSVNHPRFGMCCLQGQIHLDPFLEPPQTLKNLLTGFTPQSNTFREKIRQYNAAFAFTSTSAQINDTVLAGSGPYSFRLHGNLHHQMGSLLPREGGHPVYAQLYINDPQAALAARTSRNPNLNPMIMTDLQVMLNNVHPYVPLYKQAYQIMHARIILQPIADRRRYNLPTADEVAAIIPGNGDEDVDKHREIILRLKTPVQGSSLTRISHLNLSYAPLHYVLLFPHGEQGWHDDIPSQPGPNGEIRAPNISQRCYYAYRLHHRLNQPETVFRGGRLFQQYAVNAWASIENSELHWIRTHQKEIQADLYQGMCLSPVLTHFKLM
jgi:hypothetical protein